MLAMDVGEDYLHLPRDDDYDEYASEALSPVDALLSLHPRPPGAAAGIIPRVAVAGIPGGSELAAAVARALTTVDAPSDGGGCPICMDDDEVAWKETPCGHRFHGGCVETWLKSKGSCPMCRHQVVALPMPMPSSSLRILWSSRRLRSPDVPFGEDIASHASQDA
ncbi:putative RING finger protein [Hordeum vulgare]|nr:putative RING finger protein [Hordeum vulgare]